MGVFFAIRPYLQFDYSYQARVCILLFAFILISFVINAKVSFGEGSLTPVFNSVFYLFCFSTFLFFQTVSQGDIFRLCRALRLACVAALIIQAVLVLLDIGRPHVLISCTALMVESGSLAGIGGLVGILLIFALLNKRRMRHLTISTVLIAVCASTWFLYNKIADDSTVFQNSADVAWSSDDDLPLTEFLATRFVRKTIDSGFDFIINDRGYDRMFKYPQYLIYGAGEGAFHRFNARLEIHCLGIWLVVLTITVRNAHAIELIGLGCVLLMTMFHHGLRNPLLWIYISLILVPKIRLLPPSAPPQAAPG